MPEDEVSIAETGHELCQLIEQEQNEKGRKVIVGGFSTGGSMALHIAYRLNQKVEGVFALSSLLSKESSVFSV